MQEEILMSQGNSKIDPPPDIIVAPPPIESLLAIGGEYSFWPKELLDSAEIKKHAGTRKKLSAKLEALFQNIPNASMEISEAIDSGSVKQEFAAELYELIADFLNGDPRHKRLVLYLPFELIPRRTWRPESRELAASLHRFVISYRRCWNDLLAENDVRANFVDGDILEPELSPNGQPMVRKAAHLIPQLIQRGLIAIAEVLALMENSTDEILTKSITDTLPILVDKSLLERAECDRILRSSGLLPLVYKEKTAIRRKDNEKDPGWFRRLAEETAFALRKIEMRSALDLSRGFPKARVAWERLDKEEKLISEYADYIAALLVKDLLPPEDVRRFFSSPYEKISCLAAIRGIGKAIETIAKTNPEKARKMLRAYEANMIALWQKNMPDMRDTLTSILSRLRGLDLFNDEYMQLFGLTLPRFDASFSDNKQSMSAIVQEFVPALQSIVSNPELSRLMYPVAIFYGSFLKGYAKSNADLDVAVFVRDGISLDERKNIQKALSQIFAHEKINGKVVEFWLTETRGKLSVRDFPDADVFLADSTWAHLLFASVWFGQARAIQELYEKLLPGFLYSKGKTFEGHDIRQIWLGEMEREVLQYRLMHKGYKRFYPEQGGIPAEHSEGLGPQSSFWDSGYRRVATKLFIKKVFLPQLEKQEENK
ncbi:MAG: nucleotidyltransferase domain-containing protein [bacterium]|nr:nucleotidyltransferase domain-containing protein [bacterium]